MIKKTSQLSTEVRLDGILDRMLGGHAATPQELTFLDSFGTGREFMLNEEMNLAGDTTYVSDDGRFWFMPIEVDRQDDCEIITGVMGVRVPQGSAGSEAHGRILVFRKTHLAIDFDLGCAPAQDGTGVVDSVLEEFVEEIYNELALGR